MNAVFCEDLVKKTIRGKDIAICVIPILAAGILLQFVLPVYIVLLLAALLCVFLYIRLHVEYEYFLFEAELEITPIYNKRFRGKKKAFDMRSARILSDVSSRGKILDFSSGRPEQKKLILLVGEQKDTQLVLEPDEKMEKQLRIWISRG